MKSIAIVIAMIGSINAIQIKNANVPSTSFAAKDGDIPHQFDSSEGGDPFMEKVIKEYGNKEGERWFISKSKAKELAPRVLILDAGMGQYDAK